MMTAFTNQLHRKARGVVCSVAVAFAVTVVEPARSAELDLMTTATTTTIDTSGRPWIYVAWSPSSPELLNGKTISVYVKNGQPNSPAPFSLRAVIAPSSDPAVIRLAMATSSVLGDNLIELGRRLEAIHGRIVNLARQPDAPRDSPPELSLDARISALRLRSLVDTGLRNELDVMANGHPVLRQVLGLAWAGVVDTSIGQAVTVELRDRDPRTKSDFGVLGRVTVIAGQPELLPSPQRVVEVPDVTPGGDLNIRLRWALTDELRHAGPQYGGFHVWRMRRTDAQADGLSGRTMSYTEFRANAASGRAVRVSKMPSMPSKLFTESNVGNFDPARGGDPTTFFFADDNERFSVVERNSEGRIVGVSDRPHSDGEQFYYFLTTVDLLGRDGEPSPGVFATACRRLPPPVPENLQVDNVWDKTNGQHFRLTWLPNQPTGLHITDGYELVSGDDLGVLERANRRETNLTPHAVLNHPQTNYFDWSWLAKTENFGKTRWFAIRAVHRGHNGCEDVLSAYSPPVFGVLRERRGPSAPTGFVENQCAQLVLGFKRYYVTPSGEPTSIRLACIRRDPGVAWAEFRISHNESANVIDFERQTFSEEVTLASVNYSVPPSMIDFDVQCRVGGADGVVSGWRRLRTFQLPQRMEINTYEFLAATLSPDEATPDDPLFVEIFSTIPEALAPIGRQIGYVTFSRSNEEGRVWVIQARTSGDPNGTWEQLGAATVSQGALRIFDRGFASSPDKPRDYRGFPQQTDVQFAPCRSRHTVVSHISGKINSARVHLNFTPRSREYRLYRRVDDGPLTLIAQGLLEPQGIASVSRDDDGLPRVCARVCYYAQALDANGNPSPMAEIGCRDIDPELPSAPLWGAVQMLGTSSSPQAKLAWFSPPPGIERFEIRIASTVKAYPTIESPTIQEDIAAPAGVQHVIRMRDRSSVPQEFKQKFITGRVGGNYTPGPVFGAEFNVAANVKYACVVHAVLCNGKLGPASAQIEFEWRPPVNPNDPKIPWPARPLPPVVEDFHSRIKARTFRGRQLQWPSTPDTDSARLHLVYPVGVEIGEAPPLTAFFLLENIRLEIAGLFRVQNASRANLASFLFSYNGKVTALKGQQILPVVMYRQQVSLPESGDPNGAIVQVSPMIEAIAEAHKDVDNTPSDVLIADPFIGVSDDASDGMKRLYLLDTQPVVRGARYRYWLVRFDPKSGEPAQTIPAGQVTIQD